MAVRVVAVGPKAALPLPFRIKKRYFYAWSKIWSWGPFGEPNIGSVAHHSNRLNLSCPRVRRVVGVCDICERPEAAGESNSPHDPSALFAVSYADAQPSCLFDPSSAAAQGGEPLLSVSIVTDSSSFLWFA